MTRKQSNTTSTCITQDGRPRRQAHGGNAEPPVPEHSDWPTKTTLREI